MNDLRMAIIAATGTARKRVIPAVRERNLCAIAAIHGRDPDKLAALATQNAIPRYFVDAERMLDETKPDFVFVASPPVLHREHIRLCAERNIPVLCEKPLCLSTFEAKTIQSLLAPHPISFRIAHHLRHQPGVAALREIIAANTLGKVRRVAMQWGFWLNEKAPNASWKLDPSTAGPNAFYDAGIHAIDLMLHLLPCRTTVTAIGQQSRFRTTVDNVAALILCGGTIVELSASQSTRCPLNSLTLDFEAGTIYIPHALSEQSFTRMEITSPTETVTRTFEPVNLYGKEVEDFIALLQGQASVGTTLPEACHALQILEAITESYSSGRTIALHG
ncbi:MAG TPA: Gfo/Idh/MocA family oxidoreductase [Candidatus Sulfotelmatobacter sp.]|nr:Gfo/Idh/MocA family oxidoreductase [Candidatus Sulfotelmatobacter sp.]